MAEFDLFELTGLPFDPPEKLPKKVKIAIDKKLKELGTSLGSSTQQIERDEKKSQIDFLNGIAGKIFSTDGKKLNDSEYQPLVSQRVNAELKRLRSTATLMAQTGSLQISDGTVKFHRRERKLSEEHVREVFESLGFSIVTIDPLGAFPKFPTNAERNYGAEPDEGSESERSRYLPGEGFVFVRGLPLRGTGKCSIVPDQGHVRAGNLV